MDNELTAANDSSTLARFAAILRPHGSVTEISEERLLVNDGADTWACDASDVTATALDVYDAARGAVDALTGSEEADDAIYYTAQERRGDAWTELCQSCVSALPVLQNDNRDQNGYHDHPSARRQNGENRMPTLTIKDLKTHKGYARALARLCRMTRFSHPRLERALLRGEITDSDRWDLLHAAGKASRARNANRRAS